MKKQKSNFMDYSKVDQRTRERMDELFRTRKKNFWVRKRAFDVVFSIFAILIISPLLIVIALLIVVTDPHGGPIFRQRRIGRHGKEFYMYKFRSMVVNAEALQKELMEQNEADGPAFKIKNDPRITPVGRIIRKFSLDELPQFFNVLKGDMSLVGTRPPTKDEWSKYDLHHRVRMCTRPGITGMWQVSGRSKITDFEQVVALDQKYLDNWSVWLDFKILAKTVQVVLQHEGAV